MLDVEKIPLPLLFLLGSVLFALALEIGRRLARRARRSDDVSDLENAALGLLALLIGFTFAMALSRYDARRDAVLSEANAIGTLALRARLLPAPHGAEILNGLHEYVQLRLRAANAEIPLRDLEPALTRSNAIQEELWLQAKAVAAKDNAMVPTGLFIQALNDMIDAQGARLAAVRTRVPAIAFLGLYGVGCIAMYLVGYQRELAGRKSLVASWLVGLMIAGLITLITDIDRPTQGFVKVSQIPMLEVLNSLETYRK